MAAHGGLKIEPARRVLHEALLMDGHEGCVFNLTQELVGVLGRLNRQHVRPARLFDEEHTPRVRRQHLRRAAADGLEHVHVVQRVSFQIRLRGRFKMLCHLLSLP